MRTILLTLITLVLAIGCRSVVPEDALEQGRSCFLGVVPPSQVEQVQVWAPAAQKGDYLLNPACDDADTMAMLNNIRRNTR